MRSDRRRKELPTVPSLTGFDEAMAHVERELGVSDRRLVTEENLEAFAQ